MNQLADPFGRKFPYMRLSLTEACNFSCSYCLPNGYQADGKPKFLDVQEIRRLLRGLTALGMWKVRLTGGEPSLRKDLPEIIATVASTPGIRKVAITTNGTKLGKFLPRWKAAGLTALNVSLDSLNAERFTTLTKHTRHEEVLSGIEDALAMNFDAVKINAVLLKGVNDDELPAWMEYLRTRDLSLRFIELMQTGDNQDYFKRHHLSASVIETQLVGAGWTEKPRAVDAGPAREFAHPDYKGSVGLIAPYSKDFCVGCNRLRVTAKGDLRLCLFGNFGRPLRHFLQQDSQQADLMAQIQGQLAYKASGHFLAQGNTGITPHLASIGG